MNPERWSQIQALFDSALEQDPPKRITFLKAACKDDVALYNEVASLLASDQQINSLIDGQALDAVTVSDQMMSEARLESQLFGPYRLIKKLGQGGMGIVYLAERADGQFEQQVALKLIKRGMDSEQIVRRFLAERQILARLDHPNIARLLDGGMTEEGQPYFAMEYVEGIPLIPYCNAKKLSLPERLALFQQVCQTVQYAHNNLIVHRDLKPGNILISRDGRVKLLDFGIARMLTADDTDTPAPTVLTQVGQRVLTPEYAAPEQVTNQPITTQTDVYALGVILYELLTGLRPLKLTSHSPAEVEAIITTQEPAKPSVSVRNNERFEETHAITPEKAQKSLRGDLDTICLKALQKEPARRFGAAEELRQDIVRHLNGLPVTARPDAVSYRVSKFYGRHKAGVWATLLALLVMGTIATVYTIRLGEARTVAEMEASNAAQTAEFLKSLFEASNPLVAKGDTMNARHMLDAGATRIAEELADQPAVQASLLKVIGDAYNSLGLYPRAEKSYTEALTFTRGTQGAGSADEALLLKDLAGIRHSLSDFPTADSLEQLTLAIQKKLYGDEHPEIAATILNMASTQRSMGNYQTAVPLYEQAVAMNEKLLEKDDPELGWSINSLGWAYYNLGRYDDAIAAYNRAEDIQRMYLGADHPDLAATLNNYGGLLWTIGDYATGEPKVRESLAIRRGLYGESHPETMQSMNNLATLLFRKGEIDAAEPLYKQILETNTRLLGEKHRYVASTTSSLGAVMREKGRLDEAEALQLKALAIRTELFGDNHQQVAVSKSNLASVYQLQQRYTEAAAVYREALAFWRQQEKPPIVMAFALTGLGRVLTETRQTTEAEQMLQEALDLRMNFLGEDDLLIAEVQGALGRLAQIQGAPEKSTTLLKKALASFEANEKTTDRRALEIQAWLENDGQAD
ncbi:MAG: serine/threonine-protein kinase [Bacteroidota bacterium]